MSLKQVDAECAEVIRPAVVVTHRLAGNVSSRLGAAIGFDIWADSYLRWKSAKDTPSRPTTPELFVAGIANSRGNVIN